MTDENEKTGDLRARAIGLYTPPFRFEYGYIWDAKGQMVADNRVPDDSDGAALRVRGWGRISYMDDPEALQDEVGNIIAVAMTEHWQLPANRVPDALREAVSAIYFNDSSDYLSALWSIVRSLSPELAELLESDERAAFERVNPEPADKNP